MPTTRQAHELEFLVLRCQRGEPAAFEELVRDWERKLFFYVRRLVANEEDVWQILQEVWLQVLRGIRSLRDPRRLPVWLYAVTRNTVMSHHREEYARDRILDAAERVESTQEPECDSVDDAELVYHGLAQLPRVDREVLTLFFLRDLSIDEVAEVLGIPPGTVKSRLFKAKKSLREILERQGERS
ncbi:RNA polymerase sigma-70 factor, ECF subfamily [Singulisphaera sp. GP187]|uniref:RNA polymerase sigma factor n=1 Tax=Singulisphaera sp. GP187 TaxID=1882752 RepID=UPI000925DE2F|nr:sigma-70 family RNA polymerase sigma factor [Singulisphaera sp. GP187]SIN81142.1 RNA polymerase sigma-70 factor, ECF subfamily [Singulisphaera sp. GP187]